MQAADSSEKARLFPTFGRRDRDAFARMVDQFDSPTSPCEQKELTFGRHAVLWQYADRLAIVLDTILDSARERGIEVSTLDDAFTCGCENKFSCRHLLN